MQSTDSSSPSEEEEDTEIKRKQHAIMEKEKVRVELVGREVSSYCCFEWYVDVFCVLTCEPNVSYMGGGGGGGGGEQLLLLSLVLKSVCYA